MGEGFHPKMAPSELTVKMVSRLTQMLKDVKRFKPPDGACLSPAGEYNLRFAARIAADADQIRKRWLLVRMQRTVDPATGLRLEITTPSQTGAFVKACATVSAANRLGIMKEMQPLYVATFSEKPAVLEGHPFIVEAGVCLGGAEVRVMERGSFTPDRNRSMACFALPS